MRQMTKTTGKTEWYTPAKYIEAARRVLGEIDLDPASCEMAQRTVGARRWHGLEDDGLGYAWRGTVFLNPPYARSVVDAFIDRLALYWNDDWISAYITLTNDCMDTAWAHRLLRMSNAVCFVRGRIKFDTPAGGGKPPPRGQMFCYGGPDVAAFRREFERFGIVIELDTRE